MSGLKSMEYLKDLIQPGINGINSKFATHHKLIIDGQKLKLSNGSVIVDSNRCKTAEDQMAEMTNSFSKLRKS